MITIISNHIPLSDWFRSLEATLDNKLNLDKHVNSICKTCNFHIWVLRPIRKSTPQEATQTVACSRVGFCINFCNSRFYGMSETNFKKLQRIQNILARCVTLTPCSAHITLVLWKLHWLPVKSRVQFKLSILAYLHTISCTLDLRHICYLIYHPIIHPGYCNLHHKIWLSQLIWPLLLLPGQLDTLHLKFGINSLFNSNRLTQ
jgi:hypothetical protein